jgi:hypothetical protein
MKGWARTFNELIPLHKGKPLTTLREAALYITNLPKAEHDADEWQAAMEGVVAVCGQLPNRPPVPRRKLARPKLK